MKTRTVVFPEADRFEARELTLDAPGPGDIVVKTLVSAVSPGTERWVLRGKHLGTRFPCVPGYHRIGVVEECGNDVTEFKPGDVVYGSGNRWQDDVISMWGAHVGRSVSAPAGYKYITDAPLPTEKMEALAFAILCGVSNRGINRCSIAAGQKTLHIGAGIVGICAAQLAMHGGAESVLLDKNPDRVAYLRGALPDIPCWSIDDQALEDKLNDFAPNGVDLLQDTVGHAPTTDRLVQHVKSRGLILLQAQYFDKEKCAVDLDAIKVRELTVTTTCGTRDEDWDQTSANILSGRLRVSPLITHRFEAADLLEPYQLLHTGTPHNLGMVIHWDE